MTVTIILSVIGSVVAIISLLGVIVGLLMRVNGNVSRQLEKLTEAVGKLRIADAEIRAGYVTHEQCEARRGLCMKN